MNYFIYNSTKTNTIIKSPNLYDYMPTEKKPFRFVFKKDNIKQLNESEVLNIIQNKDNAINDGDLKIIYSEEIYSDGERYWMV